MKIKHILIVATAFICLSTSAQTADEIINKYFENIGGVDLWKKVEGTRMDGKFNQGGMEFPLYIIELKDGRQASCFTVQGKEIKQGVYDGKTLWNINFVNMAAEDSDAETTENFITNLGSSFPVPFFNYKDKGYKVELLGKETVEGTEAFKIKLTKKPIKVDGKPQDNVEFYYFDAENYVPILVESEIMTGPQKGIVVQATLSDYQEVEGGYILPMSLKQGAKGQPGGVTIVFSKVEMNPKVDPAVFAKPN